MEDKSIHEFVEHMISDGVITSEEHETFMNLVHEDNHIDAQESALISKIFKLISSGEIKVVDEQRDSLCREKSAQIKNEAVRADLEQEKKAALKLPEQNLERKKEITDAITKVKKEQEKSRNKIDEFFASRED